MKLQFSVFSGTLHKQKREIKKAVKSVYPEAVISLNVSVSILTVTLPDTESHDAAAAEITNALRTVGVMATPMTATSGLDGFPPIEIKGFKPRRTVPLSAFIVSLVCVMLSTFLIAVLIFAPFGERTLGTGDQEGEDYAGKIALVDQIFEEYSLYDTNGQLLLDRMLKAYAAATGDRYATYYTEAEYQEMMSENQASVVGIGITATEDATHHDILIINVFPNSPAMEAGLQSGDRIVSIGAGEDVEDVAELGFDAAVSRIRGEEGTSVEFDILRDGVRQHIVTTRQKVKTVSVTGNVTQTDATVGHVYISQFDTETPVQFKSVMNDLIDKGCHRFVFDVRNNPGGDLKSICAVLSYFLVEGDTIVTTTYKDGTSESDYVKAVTYDGVYASCSVSAEEIAMYRDYPMTVLANGGTASAAELFTAALRDEGLADVVGETTYGKGVLQSIIHLERWGYTGAIKLTTGYYSPPCGVNYDGVGIAPSEGLETALDEALVGKNFYLITEAEDNQLQAAIAHVKTK